MIRTLLIANRGEIAVRIARTAKAMGVRTIAVYSEVDANAAHVAACDEAHAIGPAPAVESYLRGDRIIAAAKAAGAEAIHPGYGFLSENAEFARACEAAGLIFVGPPADAIEAMGSKAGAKAMMEAARVPTVPGYHGADQSPEILAVEAERIGYPVLLKASAGGGGKGMRAVEKPDDFGRALEGACRESQAAFGDDRMLIEKYLQRPRHVEVQVFADSHGNVVHLHERDCSLQRRHQKVVEEAPAPDLTPDTRRAMGEAAVAAARAVGYVGAGTVEFIMDQDGSFYFMEMNTRLQVEHPVTEAITGLDLVAWQLQVASGEILPVSQDNIKIDGHAVEVRLYAEDPARDFLPQTGHLKRLRLPHRQAGIRVDAGVRSGDTVSVYYDPMIAKVVAHGRDRADALAKLSDALDRIEVVGLSTNAAFLARITRHPAFVGGEIDTGFLERHKSDLLPEAAGASETDTAIGCLALLLGREADARRKARHSNDPHSPWHRSDGWRLNDTSRQVLRVSVAGGEDRDIAARREGTGEYVLDLGSSEIHASGKLDRRGRLQATIAGVRLEAGIHDDGLGVTVFHRGQATRLDRHDPLAGVTGDTGEGGRLVAPMPGKIIRVLCEAGAEVAIGAPLLVLEAMKMEHTITAPANGRVVSVNFAEGELVDESADLIDFEPLDSGGS